MKHLIKREQSELTRSAERENGGMKFKIGILTYHRAENYGALLQAYALRTYLTGLGHDVDFVDYWPNYHRRYFELFSWRKFRESSLRGKMVLLYYTLFWHQARRRRQQNLQAFMHQKLGLPLEARYHNDHDSSRNSTWCSMAATRYGAASACHRTRVSIFGISALTTFKPGK